MNVQPFAGKVDIQKEIGKGQTGTIFYGYDLELRREVAIKVYHSHINGRLIRGKTFIEKAQPLLRVEHPNLIKLFKIEEENNAPVVYMEFFDAPCLQQVIHEEGPLPLEKMLLLAREVTEVLVHTHFQGIIHGSLHPGHILVGPQNRIKVMDLGLSWILMDILSNRDLHLLRPLPYLLPEIAKGELLDVNSDLYCLGFMMYEMLTKRVPYAGLPKTSIMGKLAFDQADPDFDFPENVPEAICELIRQITRNQSQHRLRDATHVLTILNQQLAKLAPEVVPMTPPSPAPLEIRMRQEHPHAESISSNPLPPPPTSDPAPRRASVVYQPKHSIDTQAKHSIANEDMLQTKKRVGLVLGILLILVGMATGYWYKTFNESSLSIPEEILQSSPPTPIPHSTLPNNSMTEEPRFKTDSLSNLKPSIPAPQQFPSTNHPDKGSDEVKDVEEPFSRSQDNTSGKTPISAKQPDPEMPASSEPPDGLRPQEDSRMTNQPYIEKIQAPVTQPSVAPEASSPLPETGQEESPTAIKQPVLSPKLPSGPSTEAPQSLLPSSPASLPIDSPSGAENGTNPPTDPPIPKLPPSVPSAPSSSGLSP